MVVRPQNFHVESRFRSYYQSTQLVNRKSRYWKQYLERPWNQRSGLLPPNIWMVYLVQLWNQFHRKSDISFWSNSNGARKSPECSHLRALRIPGIPESTSIPQSQTISLECSRSGYFARVSRFNAREEVHVMSRSILGQRLDVHYPMMIWVRFEFVRETEVRIILSRKIRFCTAFSVVKVIPFWAEFPWSMSGMLDTVSRFDDKFSWMAINKTKISNILPILSAEWCLVFSIPLLYSARDFCALRIVWCMSKVLQESNNGLDFENNI